MDKSILLLIAFALCGLVLVSAHRNPEEDSDPNNEESERNANLHSSSNNDDSDGDDEPDDDYLMNGNQLDDIDCSLEWFEEKDQFADRMNFAHSDSPVIKELIEGYRKCKSQFNNKIKNEVASMSEKYKESVEIITGDAIKAFEENGDFSNSVNDVDTDDLENGMKKFAGTLIKQLKVDAVTPQEERIQVVAAIVPKIRNVCVEMDAKFGSMIRIFDIFDDRDEIRDNVPKFTQEWLTRARACEQILKYHNLIGGAIEKVFIDDYLLKHDEERKLHDEWDKLKEKVFGLDLEEKYSPVEIADNLNRLNELFSTLNPRGLIAKDEYWYVNKLRKLIRIGNLNEANCSVETFEQIGQTRYPSFHVSTSILSYLDNIGKRQYKICIPQFEKQLGEAISELSEEQLKYIKKMSEEEFNSSSRVIYDPVISQGILKVLEARGAKLNKKISSKKLDQTLSESVDNLCQSVIHRLKDFVSSHHTIAFKVGADDLVSQKTSDWIYRYRMCDTYERRRVKVVEGIKKILSEQPKDGKKNKFLRFF